MEARWLKEKGEGNVKTIGKANYDGVLKIHNIEIPCYVLEDGTRLISHRALQKGIGLSVSGGAQHTANFLSIYDENSEKAREIAARILAPIEFMPLRAGRSVFGYEATLLADICEMVLNERHRGFKLTAKQHEVAAQCEILVRGFARVGIIALIDEVTGYQDDRPAKALTTILEAFVAKEIQKIVGLFPVAWFKEICRLKNVQFQENMRLPQYFGHIVNDLIYNRLAPGVLEELRRVNPSDGKRRKNRHYQWLTSEHGHPKVLQLIGSQRTLAQLSNTWDEFKAYVNKIHPVYREMPLIEIMEKNSVQKLLE